MPKVQGWITKLNSKWNLKKLEIYHAQSAFYFYDTYKLWES